MGQWVNSDVRKMADDLIVQAGMIDDHEVNAVVRREKLYRAASHLLAAYAELVSIPDAA